MSGIELHKKIDIPRRVNKHAFSGTIRPLRQVYRSKEQGLQVGLFSDVTGLDKNELYRKLIPTKFLTLVQQKGKMFILKDIYWDSLIAFLKGEGKEIVEPLYVKLTNCKTV